MLKLIWNLLSFGFLGLLGVSIYQGYQKGYLNLPDMPPGSYAFSMGSGFRGIVLDASVAVEISNDWPKYFRRMTYANPERQYFSLAAEVPGWMTRAWSTCTVPTEVERDEILMNLPTDSKSYVKGARFDAVCRVDIEGQPVVRGLLFSAPKM